MHQVLIYILDLSTRLANIDSDNGFKYSYYLFYAKSIYSCQQASFYQSLHYFYSIFKDFFFFNQYQSSYNLCYLYLFCCCFYFRSNYFYSYKLSSIKYFIVYWNQVFYFFSLMICQFLIIKSQLDGFLIFYKGRACSLIFFNIFNLSIRFPSPSNVSFYSGSYNKYQNRLGMADYSPKNLNQLGILSCENLPSQYSQSLALSLILTCKTSSACSIRIVQFLSVNQILFEVSQHQLQDFSIKIAITNKILCNYQLIKLKLYELVRQLTCNIFWTQFIIQEDLFITSIKEENSMKRPSIFKDQNILEEITIPSNPSLQVLKSISNKQCISNASTRKCSFDSNDTRVTHVSRFKTQTCKFWISGKQCPYANNCKFAHGTQQIRELPAVQQNYKTKDCKNFFEDGQCMYGVRCLFLHQKMIPEKQRQYYRKRMSQIHKDKELFFLNQKRLMVLRDLQYMQQEEDKQNSPSNSIISSTSGSKIDSSSSIKSGSKRQESVLFSMSNYAKANKKERHYSIRL